MRYFVVTTFLAGFILLFFVARVYGLTTSPPGFFVDESSIGYNAWTLLRTGKDEHGIPYPLYFKAFGDYKNPLFVYSVSIVFSFFGPSIETVRLTAALWGIGAIGVFGYLLWIAKVRGHALAVVLLLVLTNPWFFQLSRVAFEVSSTPFFLFVAMLAYYKLSDTLKLSNRKSIIWLSTFSIALAGTFYSYTSGRILAPVLLIGGLIFLYKKIPLWQLFLASVLCLMCVMPALFWEISNPGAMLARYQVVGLSQYTHGPADFFHQATVNYLGHFSPRFVLSGGDGNLRHIPAPFGVLLLSSLPFVLVGLLSLCTKRRGRFSYWILLGILISPIPSALTIQSPHVLRSIGLLIFVCALFWYGVEYLFSREKTKIVVVAWTVTLLLESVFSLSVYFTSYTRNAGVWFDASTVELVETGVTYPGPYYLSSKLYPGTEATVAFSQIAHLPGQKIPLERTIVFDPDVNIPNTNGVFFLDTESCQTMAQDFVSHATLVQNLSGNCLYIRKP